MGVFLPKKKKKRSSNGYHIVTALGTQLILIVVGHDSWPNSYLKGIKDVFRSAYISANGSATGLQPLLGQMWETRRFWTSSTSCTIYQMNREIQKLWQEDALFLICWVGGPLRCAKFLAFFTKKKKKSSVNVIG